MAEDKKAKSGGGITLPKIKSRIMAVKSGRTSPSFAAADIFKMLKDSVKTIDMKKGGVVKKKKKVKK
jgi:nitrogenase subunit NifH